MEQQKQDAATKKLNTLFELYPHVNCDEVRDIYEGVNNHLQQAVDTLKMIYGEPPDDLKAHLSIPNEDEEEK